MSGLAVSSFGTRVGSTYFLLNGAAAGFGGYGKIE